MKDAIHEGVLLVDEGGGQLGGVDLAVAHGHELMAVVREILGNEIIAVGDDTHGGDTEQSQMGTHQQRLGIGVGNAADAAFSVEIVDVFFKLGAEWGIFLCRSMLFGGGAGLSG